MLYKYIKLYDVFWNRIFSSINEEYLFENNLNVNGEYFYGLWCIYIMECSVIIENEEIYVWWYGKTFR